MFREGTRSWGVPSLWISIAGLHNSQPISQTLEFAWANSCILEAVSELLLAHEDCRNLFLNFVWAFSLWLKSPVKPRANKAVVFHAPSLSLQCLSMFIPRSIVQKDRTCSLFCFQKVMATMLFASIIPENTGIDRKIKLLKVWRVNERC